MADLEYTYGGQWFNDMGSLVFSFNDEPLLGVDIARAGLTRAQANDMAAALVRQNISTMNAGMTEPGV